MANGQQITFRVDDATYRQLLEEGASRGMSPHIMAKLVVQNRYGSRGGPTEELAGHFKRQYLARMQQMIAFDFTIDNVRQVFQRISRKFRCTAGLIRILNADQQPSTCFSGHSGVQERRVGVPQV